MRKNNFWKSSMMIFLFCLGFTTVWSQLTLPAGGTYTQNFDNASSTLPTGWTIRTGASNSSLGSTNALTYEQNNSAWAATNGNFRNAAAAEAPSASGDNASTQFGRTDRALGVRPSGNFGDGDAAFTLQIANTTGKTGFNLSMKHMLMDAQSRTSTYTVQYTKIASGASGWTNLGTFTTNGSWGATAANYSFGTGLDNVSNNVWIRVVALSPSTGSGSRDTYGIDDFVLTWNDGTNQNPTLSAAPSLLSGFTYVEGNGPSAAQSFTVSGTNLDGSENVSISLSGSDYEISLTENGTYSSSLNLSNYNGTSTEVFARLKAGLTPNSYTNTLTVSGYDATDVQVSLSGEVEELPQPFALPYFNGLRNQDDWDEATGYGFEFNNSTFETSASGYIRMNSGGSIITPAIDFSKHGVITASFSATTFGGSSGQELTVSVSDDGTNYTPLETFSIPGSYQTFTQDIDLSSLNGQFGRIKFEMTGGTNQIRFRDLNLDSSYVVWTINNDWADGVTPSMSDNVMIKGDLTTSENLEANSLIVGGSLTVSSGTDLTVNEGIINNASSEDFVVESGANLIQNQDVDNVGEITVYQNSTEMVRNDMTLWSSPVATQSLRDFSPETLYNRFWTYDEAATAYQALFTSDSQDQDFEEGLGYGIRVRNTLPTGQTEAMEGKFVGVPNNGDVVVPVVNTASGFNLIGNPYASNIDAQGVAGFLTVNPIVTSVYFWTHQYPVLSTGGFAGSNYAAFTQAGSNMGDLETISKGQGFIVGVNASGNVTFTNGMRSAAAADFHKTTERSRIWVSLSDDTQKYAQLLVAYMTGATSEVDNQIDAAVLDKGENSIYNMIAEGQYAIQGRALPFETTDVVPLGYNVAAAGEYTIRLENFDGLFADGQVVYLRDKDKELVYNLSEQPYRFNSEAGEFNERFEIVYGEDGAMGASDMASGAVQVYQQNQTIVVNSKTEKIVSVELFDLQGRKLHSNAEVNANTYTIPSASYKSQVLVIRVQTAEGKLTVKKLLTR